MIIQLVRAGALIDLNHLAFKHLDKAFYYLAGEDYDLCTASLHSVNAALPPEYHIEFNTAKYMELTKHPIEIYCKHCAAKYNRDEIETWQMLLPLHAQINKLSKYVSVWTCSKCSMENILSESKLIRSVLKEPFFIGVVPNPPERKQSVGDRTTFHIKYKNWFGMVESELTNQITKLRWDHHKEDEQDGLEAILTDGLELKY